MKYIFDKNILTCSHDCYAEIMHSHQMSLYLSLNEHKIISLPFGIKLQIFKVPYSVPNLGSIENQGLQLYLSRTVKIMFGAVLDQPATVEFKLGLGCE